MNRARRVAGEVAPSNSSGGADASALTSACTSHVSRSSSVLRLQSVTCARFYTCTPITADMGLEDFEKELAQSKHKDEKGKRGRSRSRDRHHRPKV